MPKQSYFSVDQLVRKNEDLKIELEFAEIEIASLKAAHQEDQAALKAALISAHDQALKAAQAALEQAHNKELTKAHDVHADALAALKEAQVALAAAQAALTEADETK